MTTKLFTFATASAIACALTITPAWANSGGGYGGHGGSYEKDRHGMGAAMMEMMMHGGAGHLIRHLLKHEKDIGLSADQVAKLKNLQLNLDKSRIKMEADIQVAEREIKALAEDEKSDIGAIESKLKQSAEVQVGLRTLSIKTRRDALSILTAEQRAKEQAEHDKMMQQHKGMGAPHGKNPHGSNPHGANPHGQGTAQ
ncbi:hypothetical protein FBQ96_05285 [Nitrospirales bacterium NOB]|nr:MAG: hypothetical protein UZ03_NOB001000468 [Nitrospira sp. OLB3]MBV6470684.1 hypothetical protein [Nitrospirota bacterium]MCE7964899.1 hypothetical protein [Nitrospira sp. NTP2]MCK6492342.1 hypothetical protein [Nitrospira sp.]MDL1888983.1 hypothetical protein [Nitrospirales bacterium NOB]MEB2338065.1 hypothetical protein [Nitrospirales bacterium]